MFKGEKLKNYLKENGITQLAFAKRLGITEGTLRHIIVGIKQPSLAVVTDIARVMGRKIDELVNMPEEG